MAPFQGFIRETRRVPVPAGLKARDLIPRAEGPGSHAEQPSRPC